MQGLEVVGRPAGPPAGPAPPINNPYITTNTLSTAY